ncbi:MAG: thiamine phosphate synthase [Pseudomonadota bacterium]
MCELYLKLPRLLTRGVLQDLREVFAKIDIACILMQLPDGHDTAESIDAALASDFRALCHDHNTALLVENDLFFAGQIGADGIHFSTDILQHVENFDDLQKRSRKDLMFGGFCTDRHEALMCGEKGFDYVAFSIAQDANDKDGSYLKWWLDLVELPCVAWDVGTHEDIKKCFAIGVDFIGLDLALLDVYISAKT